MPVFPRAFAPMQNSDVHPLLRLLGNPEAYNQYINQQQQEQEASASSPDPRHRQRNSFSPNFDVYETEHAYILEGELPGLSDKSALDIEFTDHSTLVVRGNIQRVSPTAKVEEPHSEDEKAAVRHNPPKPTVEEDEDEEDKKNKAVAQASKKSEVKKQQGPKIRYWVTERSIGHFQRTFNFPGLIEQEAVTAKLNDGILTVTVPKKQRTAPRRIRID